MEIYVKKFGGTSVGSIEKIDNIARRIANEFDSSKRYVIVVSAMGNTTDELTEKAYSISSKPCKRELDMLLTAGERISMSLLSIALQEYGITSISFTGSQSGIITDSNHGNARITDVTAFRIREELEKNKVVIVAGFQGVSPEKEVTTLGRGGSDTSAVALASYLKAKTCEIYTDVDGIYSADPRLVTDYQKIDVIDYNTVLELAYGGAKVIHPRAVEFAKKYNIELEVKSSFTFAAGTKIRKETNMEEKKIVSIAYKNNLIRNVYNKDFRSVLQILNEEKIEVFDLNIDEDILKLVVDCKSFNESKLKDINCDTSCEVQSISIIGNRIINDIEFLMQLHDFLDNNGVDIKDIKKNTVGLNIIVKTDKLEEIIIKLHKEYIK